MIELTVGLPLWYSRRIAWLALESLCRQKNISFEWELLIMEENEDAFGSEAVRKYFKRLKLVGCRRVLYTSLSTRIPLGTKWLKLAHQTSSTSKYFLLQAADCYSQPYRLRETYDLFKTTGADWVQSDKGYMYWIAEKELACLDYGPSIANGSRPSNTTMLNMALRTPLLKGVVSEEQRWRKVDSWLFRNLPIKNPCITINNSESWKLGVDTHGEGNISNRIPAFKNLKEGKQVESTVFQIPTQMISDCLPEDILSRLDSLAPATFVRIKQGFSTDGAKFFKKKFLDKYSLIPHTSREHAAIFFGCVGDLEYKRISKQKGLAVMVWLGGDLRLIEDGNRVAITAFNSFIKNNSRIKHIAISPYIVNGLKRLGLKTVIELPINPTSLPKNSADLVTPLGNYIYVYYPDGDKTRRDLYNLDLVDSIEKRLHNITFIKCSKNTYASKQLGHIYSKCFLGLRLVERDGLSNTVIELGLRGRECICNNVNLPNAIPYTNQEQIITTILAKQKEIGNVNYKLAQAVYDYLNIGNDWLYEEFYRDK